MLAPAPRRVRPVDDSLHKFESGCDRPSLTRGGSASLRFIPRAQMEAQGCGAYLDQVEEFAMMSEERVGR